MPIQSPTSKDLARKSIVELAQITYNNALVAQEAADELAPLKGIDVDAVAADAAIAEAAAASARGYSQTAAVYADNASADADNAAESADAAAASASAAASNATAARGASASATAAAVRAEAAADRAEAAAGQGGGASWVLLGSGESIFLSALPAQLVELLIIAEHPVGDDFNSAPILVYDNRYSMRTAVSINAAFYCVQQGSFYIEDTIGGEPELSHRIEGDASFWQCRVYYRPV